LYCVLKKVLKRTFALHTQKRTSFVLRTQKRTQKVGKKAAKNTPKKHIATYTTLNTHANHQKKLLKAYS